MITDPDELMEYWQSLLDDPEKMSEANTLDLLEATLYELTRFSAGASYAKEIIDARTKGEKEQL